MHILRVAFPGGQLARWVPVWDNGELPPTLSMSSMVFAKGREDDWLTEVRKVVEHHPYTVIQYEGRHYETQTLPRKTAAVRVVQHLNTKIGKNDFAYIVVPSFYARQLLRRQGYRAVTILPVARTTDVSTSVQHAAAAALTVLLHPWTTTKRSLQAIRTLSGRCFDIEWLLVNDGSKRVQTSERTLKQAQHRVRLVHVDDTDAWRQADVMVTDQHPIYSLNTLHLRVMTHGIPILTTAIGDHPELVKHWHNGFLLQPAQLVDDLTDYLNKLMREPDLLKQLRVNSRCLCEKLHSANHIKPDWLKMYRLVERGRAG